MLAWNAKQVFELRRELQVLDTHQPEDRQRYEDLRYEFLVSNEGSHGSVYADTKGLKTVGVGFNMQATDSRKDWVAAFKGDAAPPDFDQVFNGQQTLTKPQIRKLFDYSISIREERLKQEYGESWHMLTANEQLAIESANYTSYAIAGKDTRFFGHMKTCLDAPSVKEGLAAKDKALDELLYDSNRHQDIGAAFRRIAEAALLDSTGQNDDKILEAEQEWQMRYAKEKAERQEKKVKKEGSKVSSALSPEVQELARAAVTDNSLSIPAEASLLEVQNPASGRYLAPKPKWGKTT